MTEIDKLYDNYNILAEAGDKITEHEKEYLEILASVTGSANEKRLASQFIAKFFKHFPAHYDKAIDALLDLCEDEDINIRKQAIRDLPSICKDCKEYVPRITDILAQLLLAEDTTELQIVNNSLVTVCKIHPRGFLGGLFSQIESGEDLTRERVIKFLAAKMKTLPEDTWTKEDEEYFLQESRKAIQESTKEEFTTLMGLLSGLKIAKTISGQQLLVDIITEQAELDNPFNPADPELIDRFLMCVRAAIPHFSPFVPSNPFVQFLCTQMIPCMNEILSTMVCEMPGAEIAEILQQLAELSAFIQPTNTNLPINLDECQEIVFAKLMETLPSPPLTTDGLEEKTETPDFQLTAIESLMYTFYTLNVHNPEYISKISEDKLKDYKLRLQYAARLAQGELKKAREALSGANKKPATGNATTSDETRALAMTLRSVNNIITLIKELFHSKPTGKSSITLSWKPPKTKSAAIKRSSSASLDISSDNSTGAGAVTKTPETSSTATNPKRKPITAPENSEPKKEGKQIYAPPSGKFSSNFRGRYQTAHRGSGRFRGGFRGRNIQYSKRYSN